MLRGGWVNPPNSDTDKDECISLISLLEKNEIETYEEFISIIESNLPVEIEDDEVNIQNITSFEIRIDYENRIVIVTTEENASYAKAYGASNSVSRSYYTDAGIKIFTIKIDGTFSYSTGSCSTVTAAQGLQNKELP